LDGLSLRLWGVCHSHRLLAGAMTLTIDAPSVFKPLDQPSRYKGMHGGRGSGKSWHAATMLVLRCLKEPGIRVVCAREIQKTLAESAKRLIEDRIASLGVGHMFNVQHDKVITPGNGSISFWGLADKNAQSIKSLEGVKVCWIEESQTLSKRSLDLLRPTIRAEGSEIWATWNPTRKSDAIDQFLRQNKPENAIVVEANWRDNPFFPGVLNEERQLYLSTDPGAYEHIWGGGYATAVSGSYFGDLLTNAKREGRISELHIDPMLEVRAFFDIGVADATSIWIAQFSGGAVHVIDYIEGVSQPLSYYVNELRSKGYEKGRCILPHDGVNKSVITGKRYEDHLRDAGFKTEVFPNAGAGAARMRIEAVRRILPRCHFDEKRCEAGLEALNWYHERQDEHREVGLGPLHDWSSHAADSFGLLAVSYSEPSQARGFYRKLPRSL
jgi:phage terminase large subunit